MYFPGNILLYELTFRTSYLLKSWWIPASSTDTEDTVQTEGVLCYSAIIL